jgi:hypothetical protein
MLPLTALLTATGLIRYVVEAVHDANRHIVGALILGDLVNGKKPICSSVSKVNLKRS